MDFLIDHREYRGRPSEGRQTPPPSASIIRSGPKRPLLIIQPLPGETPTKEEVLKSLEGQDRQMVGRRMTSSFVD